MCEQKPFLARFNASEVIINATASLEDKNGKIHISTVDLVVKHIL